MPVTSSGAVLTKRPRGRPPIPIVDHPEPLWEVEYHPLDFHDALDLQMRRHGEPAHRLRRAIEAGGGLTDRKTIFDWRRRLTLLHCLTYPFGVGSVTAFDNYINGEGIGRIKRLGLGLSHALYDVA